MRNRAARTAAVLLAGSLLAYGSVRAQQPPGPGDRSRLRLTQRFFEDAAVARGGWVEGQFVYDNLDDGTAKRVGPLVAFRVSRDMEAGLRFAFLDVSDGIDGSGLSDLDLYYKVRFPGASRTRFAAGTVIKMPTADETEGLGTGRTDVEIFGAVRADLVGASVVANAGLRHNGSPDPPLPDARTSYLAGGGILLPMAQSLSFGIEASWESERLEGGEPDTRLTVGLQGYGPQQRGGWRGALGIPLTDGAPDFQVIFGLFFSY